MENTSMRELTEKATEDAAAVKVLTIMTLVYLHTTVVSVSLANVCRVAELNSAEFLLNVVCRPGGKG